MKKSLVVCPRGLERAGKSIMQGAVLALLIVLTLPARAADARAIKSRVTPTYPEIAKRLHISGLVKVEATVDASGKVTDVKALSGNEMLSIAALDAVRKWKFESGTGSATVDIDINFNPPAE
jgi:TonB family protein